MRINLDDELYRDPRFMDLCIAMGNKFEAIGHLVTAWNLAQKYWVPNRKLIPISKWEQSGINAKLFDCHLAEKRPDGVYVRGAVKKFEWYFDGLQQRREAGKHSAEVRKAKFGSAVPKNASNSASKNRTETERPPNENRTGSERAPNERQREPNESEPSYSSSLYTSSSFSSSESASRSLNTSENEKKAERRSEAIEQKPNSRSVATGVGSAVWDSYSKAYADKHGDAPPRNAKQNALCAQLVKRLGAEEAPEVASYYLKHHNFLYQNAGHPLGLLVRDCEKIRTEWATGKRITTAGSRQAEIRQHNQQAVEEYLSTRDVEGVTSDR